MNSYLMKRKDGTIILFNIGDKYNRLTILDMYKEKSKTVFKCKCDCGKIVDNIQPFSLISGNTKSCGCYNKELRMKRNLKHNDAHRENKTRLYKIWIDMRKRCNNPNTKSAKNYYFKNIKVCEAWNDYNIFKEWALNNGYNDDLTIERIDNSLGYNPENCKWILKSEQSKNRTTNHYISYNGETHTLTEWCKIKNISRTTLYKKLKKGITVEQIFE